jgi:hypothetical protein
MTGNPSSRDKRVDLIFDTIGSDIGGAVSRTPEQKVQVGEAVLTNLIPPINAFSTSYNNSYKYLVGCNPKSEFGKGIGALLIHFKSEQGPDVTCAMGATQDGQYRLVAHTMTGNEVGVLMDETFPEDQLPETLVLGAGLEQGLTDYRIESVQGLINGSRR